MDDNPDQTHLSIQRSVSAFSSTHPHTHTPARIPARLHTHTPTHAQRMSRASETPQQPPTINYISLLTGGCHKCAYFGARVPIGVVCEHLLFEADHTIGYVEQQHRKWQAQAAMVTASGSHVAQAVTNARLCAEKLELLRSRSHAQVERDAREIETTRRVLYGYYVDAERARSEASDFARTWNPNAPCAACVYQRAHHGGGVCEHRQFEAGHTPAYVKKQIRMYEYMQRAMAHGHAVRHDAPQLERLRSRCVEQLAYLQARTPMQIALDNALIRKDRNDVDMYTLLIPQQQVAPRPIPITKPVSLRAPPSRRA